MRADEAGTQRARSLLSAAVFAPLRLAVELFSVPHSILGCSPRWAEEHTLINSMIQIQADEVVLVTREDGEIVTRHRASP